MGALGDNTVELLSDMPDPLLNFSQVLTARAFIGVIGGLKNLSSGLLEVTTPKGIYLFWRDEDLRTPGMIPLSGQRHDFQFPEFPIPSNPPVDRQPCSVSRIKKSAASRLSQKVKVTLCEVVCDYLDRHHSNEALS